MKRMVSARGFSLTASAEERGSTWFKCPGFAGGRGGGGVDVFAFGFDSHRITLTLTSTRASFFDATTY